MKKLLPLLLLIVFSCEQLLAQTPSITWVAQNLPPGLAISRINSQTAKITGSPTTAGVYDVVYFPMVAGVAGDMRRVRVNVLPTGLNLPQLYGYARRLGIGVEGRPTFRSGGGGWFFGTVDTQTGIFSPNGQTFRSVALPAVQRDISAVTFGSTNASTTVLAGRSVSHGNLVTFRSLNQGAFQPIVGPAVPASNSLSAFGLASVGDRVLLVTTYYGISSSLKIHTLDPNQTSWVERASLVLNSPLNFYSTVGVSVVPQATGLLLALRSQSGGDIASFLMRSTSANGSSGWSLEANPHSIISLAAGNGWIVGSSTRGVLRSNNGLNWVWVSRRPVGPVVFSPPITCFSPPPGIRGKVFIG